MPAGTCWQPRRLIPGEARHLRRCQGGQLRAQMAKSPARHWLAGWRAGRGIDIWSMHFVGMFLAFNLPHPDGYDLPLSWQPPLAIAMLFRRSLHRPWGDGPPWCRPLVSVCPADGAGTPLHALYRHAGCHAHGARASSTTRPVSSYPSRSRWRPGMPDHLLPAPGRSARGLCLAAGGRGHGAGHRRYALYRHGGSGGSWKAASALAATRH